MGCWEMLQLLPTGCLWWPGSVCQLWAEIVLEKEFGSVPDFAQASPSYWFT